MREGICVDPLLCRGTSQGQFSSCTKNLVCVCEIVGKEGEAGIKNTCAGGQRHVRQGMRHDTWMTIISRTPMRATLSCAPLSHACSRDEV